jgi:hypothetical protein
MYTQCTWVGWIDPDRIAHEDSVVETSVEGVEVRLLDVVLDVEVAGVVAVKGCSYGGVGGVKGGIGV